MPILEKPANGFSVGALPHFHPLALGQLMALVEFKVAREAQGRDPVVVSLDASPLPITQLV